jgi:ABC-2 type transport system permease protein
MDLARLTVRIVRGDTRRLDALLISMILPVMIMAVFVWVFGGAITTGSAGLRYIEFVVPAVLLMAAGYGAAMTAASIAHDMNEGMIDRLRTLPIGGWVLPASHVAASLARNLVAATLALAAAVGLGFRPQATPTQWVLILALLCGYILALASVAVVWGLVVRSVQAAEAFSFLVLFLPYVSNGFVPAETMPPLLRGFAAHQPITPLAETLRALLLGQSPGAAAVTASAWIAGAAAVSIPLAAVLFRRRISV